VLIQNLKIHSSFSVETLCSQLERERYFCPAKRIARYLSVGGTGITWRNEISRRWGYWHYLEERDISALGVLALPGGVRYLGVGGTGITWRSEISRRWGYWHYLEERDISAFAGEGLIQFLFTTVLSIEECVFLVEYVF
jgi:hypothetical protein